MSDEILKEVEDLRSLDGRHTKMPNEFVDFPNNSVLYSESWCAAHIEHFQEASLYVVHRRQSLNNR